MKKIIKTDNILINLPLIIALIIVLISLFIEYFFDAYPCELCSYARILWLVFCIFYILFKNKIIIFLTLLFNLGISMYHSAKQYQLIDTGICPISFDKPFLDCNLMGFTILGLPLSVYNIFSVIFVILIYSKVNHLSKNKTPQ